MIKQDLRPRKIVDSDYKVGSATEEGWGGAIATTIIGAVVIPALSFGAGIIRAAQMTWYGSDAWKEQQVFLNMIPPYMQRIHGTTDPYALKAELYKMHLEIKYDGQLHDQITTVDALPTTERLSKLLEIENGAAANGIKPHEYKIDNPDMDYWYQTWGWRTYTPNSNNSVSRLDSLIMDNYNSQVLQNLVNSIDTVQRTQTELLANQQLHAALQQQMIETAKAGDMTKYQQLQMQDLVLKQTISDETYVVANQTKVQSDLLYQLSDTTKEIDPISKSVGQMRTEGLVTYDELNRTLNKIGLVSFVTTPGWAIGGYILGGRIQLKS